ncbi:MAG: ribonuclease HII, partial [Gammaproteobacteria bacterium]
MASGSGEGRTGGRAPGRATRIRRARPVAISVEGIVCGVDEAGRGPLAGPVYAAAVVLAPDRPIRGLRDSKMLTPQVRERLSRTIKLRAAAWAVASASVAEIDELNILQASL